LKRHIAAATVYDTSYVAGQYAFVYEK
jgi:hypothetical protein